MVSLIRGWIQQYTCPSDMPWDLEDKESVRDNSENHFLRPFVVYVVHDWTGCSWLCLERMKASFGNDEIWFYHYWLDRNYFFFLPLPSFTVFHITVKMCPRWMKLFLLFILSSLATLHSLTLSSILLFLSLSLASSSVDIPWPMTTKSLFMRTIMWSKALNLVWMPRGYVACLSLVSCPIQFKRVEERASCTNQKKKKQTTGCS